jgi:hypothetical protein
MSALGEWTARNLDSLFPALTVLVLGCLLLFAPRKMLRRVMRRWSAWRSFFEF